MAVKPQEISQSVSPRITPPPVSNMHMPDYQDDFHSPKSCLSGQYTPHKLVTCQPPSHNENKPENSVWCSESDLTTLGRLDQGSLSPSDMHCCGCVHQTLQGQCPSPVIPLLRGLAAPAASWSKCQSSHGPLCSFINLCG